MPYLDRFKTIIFDFDGVILDSARLKTAAFAQVYSCEDPEKVAEVVEYQEQHGGIGRRQKFEYFEREVFGRPGDEATVENLCDRFAEIIDEGMLNCAFIPGAEALLALLERLESAEAAECLAVGDSPTEFHAARKIGIPFLAIVAPDVVDLFPADVQKAPDLTGFERAARLAR